MGMKKEMPKPAFGKLNLVVGVAVDDDLKARVDRLKAKRAPFNERARALLYSLAQDMEDEEKG